MVSRSSGDDELSGALYSPLKFNTFLKEVLRVDQCSLMSDVLRTLAELVSKIRPHVIFKLSIRTQIDSVPELGLPRMQVVDTVKV